MNTVGFMGVLHPLEETKLVTPCTYQTPSAPLQFRGPPESPCRDGRRTSEGNRATQGEPTDAVATRFFFVLGVAYMAAGAEVAAATDHGGLHRAPPPVAAAAFTVPDHGEESLLELGGNGTPAYVRKKYAIKWGKTYIGRAVVIK